MFERHFGLRENPFHSGHQMRFLYPSREHQEARAHLRYGIENREPFVLITGEVGTGKTTALYDALAEWGSQVTVALVTNSSLDRNELIQEICIRFGLVVAPGTGKPQSLAQLERHLLSIRSRGEHAVLLLDEAQNLAAELLEEIRLLSNLETAGEKLLQIFLVGQPELEAKLSDHALRQLRQRISVHYRLNPLSPEETIGYIHHRVAVAGGNPVSTFPADTCREIYRITHGIPREINTVAGQSMIAAFTDGTTTVQPVHVRTVAEEGAFNSVLGQPGDDVMDMEIGAEAEDARAPEPAAAAPAAPPAHAVPIAPAEPAPAAAQAAPEPEPVPEPEEDAGPVWTPPAWLPPILDPARPAGTRAGASAATPAPVVTPQPATPEPENTEPHVEPVEREELDAWTVAARDLMQARRQATPRDAEEVAYVPSTPAAHVEDDEDDEPGPNAFPTRAELQARAPFADPARADITGLPERLRRKIEDDIAREERPSRRLPAVLAGIAVVAVVVGAVMLQRFQVIDLPFLRGVAPHPSASAPLQAALPTPAPASPASVPHDSAAALARAAAAESAAMAHPAQPTRLASTSPEPAQKPATSMAPPATQKPALAAAPSGPAQRPAVNPGVATSTIAAPKPAASATVATTTPPGPKPAAPASAKPAASTSTAANTSAPAETPASPKPAAPAPKPAGSFGVGVGSYLDKDRADQERARLAALAKLPAVVVPFTDHGTTMYRVVLGSYATNAAAERAAGAFMEKYGVSEGMPLKLPKSN